MIKIENTSVHGITRAVYSARNAMNSWNMSDSDLSTETLGVKDLDLARRLCKAGSDHRKFLRMIDVTVDVTAPMYWWSEADTYKVGTVRESCSKMHKLLAKPFEISDFSFDGMDAFEEGDRYISNIYQDNAAPIPHVLNDLRDSYMKCEDEDEKKKIWYAILQLLPCSYNQMSTLHLNYEVLRNMYNARKNHKLKEWHVFCEWISNLPYSELITG